MGRDDIFKGSNLQNAVYAVIEDSGGDVAVKQEVLGALGQAMSMGIILAYDLNESAIRANVRTYFDQIEAEAIKGAARFRAFLDAPSPDAEEPPARRRHLSLVSSR